jgi:glycosyltransferase involved in cell wall biosynthesis
MNQKLTIIILTHGNLKTETLNSASFADEIILLNDSRLKKITFKNTNHKTKIINHKLENFASQRNYALSKSTNDWCLFLDSDEIISEKLATEIKNFLKKPTHNGVIFRRLDCYHGQTLNYGEIGQTRLLRLARKSAGKWQRPVHEFWKIKGKTTEFVNPLFHLRHNLTSGFFSRLILYSPLDASALAKEGKPFSYYRLFIFPLAKFFHNYLIRLGFLDGTLGLFHAYLMSLQSLTVRVYQKQEHLYNNY